MDHELRRRGRRGDEAANADPRGIHGLGLVATEPALSRGGGNAPGLRKRVHGRFRFSETGFSDAHGTAGGVEETKRGAPRALCRDDLSCAHCNLAAGCAGRRRRPRQRAGRGQLPRKTDRRCWRGARFVETETTAGGRGESHGRAAAGDHHGGCGGRRRAARDGRGARFVIALDAHGRTRERRGYGGRTRDRTRARRRGRGFPRRKCGSTTCRRSRN